MPAYDYRCTACRELFEITRSSSDDAVVCCPECGAPSKRVFTPVGVVFKGSGFYSTDSKTKSAAGSSPSEAGSTDGAAPAAPPCPATQGGGCAGCPAAADA